mgnify:CR=1 FL=1
MPAAALMRAGCNDSAWHQGTDIVSAFEPVRAALAADSPANNLASALTRSRTPAEFRRWMKHSLVTADSDEQPLLAAFQTYFEALAGAH